MKLSNIISVLILSQSVNAAFNVKDLFNLGRVSNNTLPQESRYTTSSSLDDDYTTTYAYSLSAYDISSVPTDYISSYNNYNNNDNQEYTSDNIIIPPTTTTTSSQVFPSVNPSDYKFTSNPSTYRASDTQIDISNPSTYRASDDTNTYTDTQFISSTPVSTPSDISSTSQFVSSTETPIVSSDVSSSINVTSTASLLIIPTSQFSSNDTTSSISSTTIPTLTPSNFVSSTISTFFSSSSSSSSSGSTTGEEQVITTTSSSTPEVILPHTTVSFAAPVLSSTTEPPTSEVPIIPSTSSSTTIPVSETVVQLSSTFLEVSVVPSTSVEISTFSTTSSSSSSITTTSSSSITTNPEPLSVSIISTTTPDVIILPTTNTSSTTPIVSSVPVSVTPEPTSEPSKEPNVQVSSTSQKIIIPPSSVVSSQISEITTSTPSVVTPPLPPSIVSEQISVSTPTSSSHIIMSFDPSATSTTTTTLSYPGMSVPIESNVEQVTSVSSIAQPSTTRIVSISSQISINDNVPTTILIASTTTHVSAVANQTIPRPVATNVVSSISASKISSISSSKQNPNWWIPTKIITDSDVATTAEHTLNASETANMPQMIMSPHGDVDPAVGYSLITIGLKKALNYKFVVANPQSSVQIMSFLPNVLNSPFNETYANLSVIRLVPLQDDSIPYLVTVAEVYFPECSIDNLAAMIKDPLSKIYSKNASSQEAIDMLAQLIDPSIPITGLIGNMGNSNGNNNNDNNTNNGNQSNQSNMNNNDDQNLSNNDDIGSLDGSEVGSSEYNGKNVNSQHGSTKTNKNKIAGIVIGSVIGAFVYFVIMGFLLRYGINRYKKHDIINYPVDENSSISSNESSFNEKMNHSPSWSSNHTNNSNSNTIMSSEVGVAINAKKGKSVKLKISGPLASENSLGF